MVPQPPGQIAAPHTQGTPQCPPGGLFVPSDVSCPVGDTPVGRSLLLLLEGPRALVLPGTCGSIFL